MSLGRVFGGLVVFFLIGGVAAALAQKSLVPLVVVLMALWVLLRFTNSLGRRP